MISYQRSIVIVVLIFNFFAALRISGTPLFSISEITVYHCLLDNKRILDSPRYQLRAPIAGPRKENDSAIIKKTRKYKKGDTLFYCEVVKLSNQDYREHVFAIFGYAFIAERKGRSKIRIKYILNRERNYLSKVFYSKAIKMQRKRVDVSLKDYIKILEKKYPNVRMWGVLDANAML